MARMCCSNWLVAAPSIVQWPLLWTRGASSLTTSEPSAQQEQLGGQRADHVELHRDPRGQLRRLADDGAVTGDGAGATDSTRIPRSWRLRDGGNGDRPTGEVAGDDHRQLAGEVELGLEQQPGPPASGPRAVQAASIPSGPSGAAIRTWLRPSYPPMAALSRSGKPSARVRRRRGRRGSGPRARARSARRSPRGTGARPGGPGSSAGRRSRPDGQALVERLDDRRRDVLQLVGDDRAAGGELEGGVHVVVGGNDLDGRRSRAAGQAGSGSRIATR